MQINQRATLLMLGYLPLFYDTNYFCLREEGCPTCAYGKMRGICDKKGSVQDTISKKVKDLAEYISEHYWNDINFKMEELWTRKRD